MLDFLFCILSAIASGLAMYWVTKTDAPKNIKRAQESLGPGNHEDWVVFREITRVGYYYRRNLFAWLPRVVLPSTPFLFLDIFFSGGINLSTLAPQLLGWVIATTIGAWLGMCCIIFAYKSGRIVVKLE